MIKTKKTFVQRCDKPLTSITRAALTGHLKHDRQAMAGLLADYDPSLGNRASLLRKLTGANVICLVLGRSKW